MKNLIKKLWAGFNLSVLVWSVLFAGWFVVVLSVFTHDKLSESGGVLVCCSIVAEFIFESVFWRISKLNHLSVFAELSKLRMRLPKDQLGVYGCILFRRINSGENEGQIAIGFEGAPISGQTPHPIVHMADNGASVVPIGDNLRTKYIIKFMSSENTLVLSGFPGATGWLYEQDIKKLEKIFFTSIIFSTIAGTLIWAYGTYY